MSLPANLFVDTPEMEDVSLHQLGNDTETWPEEIIQKVKERLPRAQGMNLMVKFMKKDDENGVATGSVMINSADKVAVVPVIIKDFMMFPLDVMIANSKLLPLTPDYFNAVFVNNALFDKIEEFPTFGGLGRFEDANLWNAIYPPSLGRYAYASSGEYPVLEALGSSIDGTELRDFLKNPANEKVAARLLIGPHKEIITKLARLQPVNMNEFRQGVENLIPRSITMLRRGSPNKYTLLSSSDTVFHPGITKMDRSGAMKHLSTVSAHAEDDINDVDQNGEKFLHIPPPKNNVILAKEDSEQIVSADEYDHYSVKTKTGVSVEGVVVPHVMDFDQKRLGLKLFIGKTMSTVQPEVFGVRLKNSRFHPESQVPKVGQTGTFLYQPDTKHALATVPVTITGVTSDCGTVELRAQDLMGRPMKITLQQKSSFELHRIAKTAPGQYIVPSSMKWVGLEDMGEVTNSVDDYAVKQAGERLTNRPVTVIPTGFGQYSVRGVDKYARAMGADPTNLDGYQVKFILAALGAGSEKIAHIMKSASKRGSAEVHNLNFIPLSSEKVADARPLARAMSKVASSLKHNLLKEASYLENSQTVDALLSLNFVSPTNVAKYVGKLPALKSAISHLASMLLASRLGMKEIPESAAASGMARLVEVVDGLERLKATQEVAAQGA